MPVDALRTDCVYRLGVCFEHLKRRESAEHCFRQYINLLLAGMKGTYPIDDAAQHILTQPGQAKRKPRNAMRDAIRDIPGGLGKLPQLSLAELLAT